MGRLFGIQLLVCSPGPSLFSLPPSLPPFTSKHCSCLHRTAVTLATTTLMFTFGPENAYMDTHSKSRVPKDQ